MRCRLCGSELLEVHGHEVCIRTSCPMFGVSQVGCCEGETMENRPLETTDVTRVAAPGGPRAPGASERTGARRGQGR